MFESTSFDEALADLVGVLLAGKCWRPVLMDFNGGVTNFAAEIPVFDSGILGLVTLLVNLVLGTVGGLLPI